MKTWFDFKCNGSSNEIVWFNFHYTQSEEAAPIDQYLVCGEHYKTIRNAVAKGIMEGKVDGLDETCEVMLHHFLVATLASGQDSAFVSVFTWISCSYAFSSQGCRCLPQWTTVYLLLALYREVTTLYREVNVSFHPKPEVH